MVSIIERFHIVLIFLFIVSVIASDNLTTISQQLQMSLEQLCVLMDMMFDNIQILQYTLSFFTLSLINGNCLSTTV